VLYRLAIIQMARQLGFTLVEIRELFCGFRNATRASERWQTLSRKKLAELEGLMDGIKTVRRLLKKMMQNCRCDTLEQCGREIFRRGGAGSVSHAARASRRLAAKQEKAAG
jgi:DNA-binding transcriptional MerR regulator